MGDLAGWPYWKVISLTGQAGAGTDYQAKLTIGDSAGGDFHLEGHCTNFPQDIRITDDDGTTLLDHWVKDLTADPIVVYAEVKDDLGSNRDIRVYYGKNGESTDSNITNTMLFGDDFPGSSLDTSKWDEYGTVTDSVSGGVLTTSSAGGYDAGQVLLSDSSYGNWTDLVIESRLKSDVYQSGSWEPCIFARATDPGADDDTYDLGFYSVNNNVGNISKFVGGSYSLLQSPSGQTQDTNWHNCMFVVAGTSLKGYQDGTLITSTTDSSHSTGRIGLGNTGGTRSGKYDWVFVRKYNDPEPAFSSAGAEQTPAGGVAPTGVFYGPLVGPFGGPI